MFTKADKDANTLIAMNELIRLKWHPMSAAAIVGNLTAESYLDPDTGRGDDNTAMGLAQWRDERVTKFEEIIGKHVEDASLLEQLAYVNWELRNKFKKAGERLKKATTIEEKTAIIDKYYERSAGLHGERRLKFAKAALAAWEATQG
jgi:hypothetical protein